MAAEQSLAEEHFSNGIAASLSDDQLLRAIDELEKAIALGLPKESEMQAHYFLVACNS